MIDLPTIADFKSHRLTRLLVYCSAPCWHHSSIAIEGVGDTETVISLSNKVKCSKCGRVGAEVRPDWNSGPEEEAGTPARGWIMPP